jgi:hypothetical protein
VRIGVLVTGDTAVRAAHSLSAHPGIDEVVVVGPARSRSFRVVAGADDCDLLLGTGPEAPGRAAELGVDLVWDGDEPGDGVSVWGASPVGLTLALASRETDPRLVAVAHPELGEGSGRQLRFPDPVGVLSVTDTVVGGRPIAVAQSTGPFAAALIEGARRRVTIVDDGAFLAGIALAAAATIARPDPAPVWDRALEYLQAAMAMGLVMAEDR